MIQVILGIVVVSFAFLTVLFGIYEKEKAASLNVIAPFALLMVVIGAVGIGLGLERMIEEAADHVILQSRS